MEWAGWVALMILLFYSSFPGKVRKLEKELKKLKKKQQGGNDMSKIINQLIGKNCKILADQESFFDGSLNVECMVLDADEEWIKFTYTDKKNMVITKILRIDSIENIELIHDQNE